MILLLAAFVWLVAAFVITARAAIAMRNTTRPDKWLRLSQDAGVLDALALGMLGVATLLFFWRPLSGQVWMPAGGGDLAQFLYPTYRFAAEWWRRGIIPLWNPYLFAGAPFVGDIQSGIFYPFNLLTFLVSNPLTFRDMEFLSVLHFLIAGAGMYAFLRWGKLEIRDWRLEIGDSRRRETALQSPIPNPQSPISRAAALAGAVAFEFSDLFITHFGNLNLIAVAAWTPLVLLFYRRSVRDRRPALAAIAGVVLAVAYFAGHIQAFLFILMALVMWTLYEIADMPQSSVVGRASHVLPLAMLVVTGVVAIGLVSPSLLPNIEMTQYTLRADYSYEQASQYSLPPAELIGLFVPGFFGRGPQATWAPWPRVEVGYIGILPLVLALLALLLRRDRLTRFLGIVAFLGLILALGGYSILQGWLYQFVPGFGQLRAPARFIFLFDFAIAALAALGFDVLLHALPRSSARIFKRIVRVAPWVFLLIALAAGSTGFAMLALGQGQDPVLFNRMANATNALVFFVLLLGLSVALVVARGTRFFRRRAWSGLALALIFFDLFSLGAYVDVSTDDPTRAFEHPEAVAFLTSQPELFRIDDRETGVDAAWPADTGILYGLYDVNGDNPLVLADYERYWQSLGSRSTALYDLLNVRYLIGRKNVPLDQDKFKLAFDGDPALEIHENGNVLPRAAIVFDRRPVGDHAAAFESIHAPDFDPLRTVVLEGESGEYTPALAGGARGVQRTEYRTQNTEYGDGQGAVKITGYGPNEIELEMASGDDGVLVLSEVYYPGWRAWVDDREVKVLRADYLFRAVELPAGEHRVRLVYDPWSFKVGVGIFVVTIVGLIAWSMVARRRVKQNQRYRIGLLPRRTARFCMSWFREMDQAAACVAACALCPLA